MSGVIAIVGRPNVGKSALFNRIVGQRIAIVHDQPGVTRDRITAEAEWHGRPFTLVDTGGIGLLRRERSEDVIIQAAFEQVQLALESANVILLVVNVQEGVVPLDREVATRLRESGKQVFVLVNKVDTFRTEQNVPEFSALGFEKVFPVSAIHGLGIGAVMDAAMPLLPAPGPGAEPVIESVIDDASEPEVPPVPGEEGVVVRPGAMRGLKEPYKLAIVGRPNVGKSSIVNALTKSERVIVSPVPGTTRDSVDVPFEVETEGVRQKYVLIDTAGMRKTNRVADSIEFFSVKRAEYSIARADIVVLVLDAESGILEQDKKVADKIVEARKACIVVVNKWDLVADDVKEAIENQPAQPRTNRRKKKEGEGLSTLAEFGAWVQEKLFFLDYAPVIFTSAKSSFHLERLLEAIRYVTAQLQQKIPTALLNRTLHGAIEKRQPVSAAGHRLKFFYATQVRQSPATFLLFVNKKELFTDRYEKYLADEMRRSFGYEGCPLLLVPKPRIQTIEPARTRQAGEHAKRGGPQPKRPGERRAKRPGHGVRH